MDVTERPVFYRGVGRAKGSFIRVGEADEPMSDNEIYSYDAYRKRIRDDIRTVDGADMSHIDSSLLDEYIAAVKKHKPHAGKLSGDEILRLMGIVKGGVPTLAGLLCFSPYPQALFPQLCVTAVVVPGTKMGVTGSDVERFSDNRRIEGTIAEMLDETVRFIGRNMREKTIVGRDGKRKDKTEYPISVVREAALNALMHRDYSIHTEGAPVRVLMFNDRLEIWSEGGLYGNLTISSIGKVHAVTRNQTLANILEILKIAENRYSGIPTIRSEMASYKLPEPLFESRRGNFIVTLRNGRAGGEAGAEAVEEASIGVGMGAGARMGASRHGCGGAELLDFCKEPKARYEIAAFLNVTQYYAMKTHVNPLVASGKLKLAIPSKPKSRNQRYYSSQ